MKQWLYLMAAGLGIFPTAGCMAGMHGGPHGMHGGTQHGAMAIVKEVRNELATVTLTVPPLIMNRESVLQIIVLHAVTNEPIADAEVAVTVRGLGGGGGSTPSHSMHVVQNPQASERVAVQQEAPGAYRAPYTFRSPGPHEISVAVHRADSASAPTLVEFTATQEVAGAEQGTETGPSKTWIVLGGAAMAAMMVLRWVVF